MLHQLHRFQPIRACSLLLMAMLFLPVQLLHAENALAPPDDPAQSITYWRQHILAPEKDSLAAMAQGVFEVVLRAWDSSRLEPGLHVVRSSAGPWAASLADGNILLSRKAIEICLKFGKQRAEHLLAFVLAHELAHQRSDDLWHQRFFRLTGNQGADVRRLMLNDLNKQTLNMISQKENQADHDGLIMMGSVGYDPYQVIDEKDFFTTWVENVWHDSCSSQKSVQKNHKACMQAKDRAIRTRAQLKAVANQSVLYEMGVQAFIAGDYNQARRYFVAYGRDYTNRAVLTAIGQTYFAEALLYYQQLVEEKVWQKPVFYYPLMIDASTNILLQDDKVASSAKRSAMTAATKKIKRKLQHAVQQSIEYYDKAIRLEPKYSRTYILQAFSYLLGENPYMVRGIIQGKYIPEFGKDYMAELVLSMTGGMEGQIDAAEKGFKKLRESIEKGDNKQLLLDEAIIYSIYHNSASYAVYLGKKELASQHWQNLADYAREQGSPVLFQLAVKHLQSRDIHMSLPDKAPTISGVRLGDRKARVQNEFKTGQSSTIWIEGDKFKVYRLNNGQRFVLSSDNRVINAWQDAGQQSLVNGLGVGDEVVRAMSTFGTPDRQLSMISGTYLAYDNYGLAMHVLQNRIAGWFLYQPK